MKLTFISGSTWGLCLVFPFQSKMTFLDWRKDNQRTSTARLIISVTKWSGYWRLYAVLFPLHFNERSTPHVRLAWKCMKNFSVSVKSREEVRLVSFFSLFLRCRRTLTLRTLFLTDQRVIPVKFVLVLVDITTARGMSCMLQVRWKWFERVTNGQANCCRKQRCGRLRCLADFSDTRTVETHVSDDAELEGEVNKSVHRPESSHYFERRSRNAQRALDSIRTSYSTLHSWLNASLRPKKLRKKLSL